MLQWPLMREAHFLHYIAYLINEHNFVPYRDVLETSWFGTFLFHMAIGKLLGYSAIAFRTADILFLATLLFVTWKILHRLDIWLAWIGSLSFGLTYLHCGPANSLQRDYVLLLPIATALLVALQTDWRYQLRAFIIGICFGAAFSVKPHSLIGLPAIAALLYSQSGAKRSPSIMLLYCICGGACIPGLGLLWLWHVGGLASFIDTTLHYLPLYQELNGAHAMSTPPERWQNTMHWWKYFLWSWPYSIAVGFAYGWYNTDRRSQQRALIFTIVLLSICYNIYPLISGKFWDYHWIPYSYFAVLGTSVLLLPAQNNSGWKSLLSLCLLLFFMHTMISQYAPSKALQYQIDKYPDITIDQQFENNVADFIRQHLQQGEKIQVIDQGGPSTLYLIKAEAVLATPYLGSFMFLHHINKPYIQQAQQYFLQTISEKPPALFLVMTDFTKPSGINTISEVPGLNDFLHKNYNVIWSHALFTIWERRNTPSTFSE
jgi:hypothetical protein